MNENNKKNGESEKRGKSGKLALGTWGGKLCAALGKYKYVFLVILAGVILLLVPTFGAGVAAPAKNVSAQSGVEFDVTAMEHRLEGALSQVEGAGATTVVLTIKSGARSILAQDSKTTVKDGARDNEVSTVVVSRGSGTQETVALQELSPQFQGALVVCPGGDNPTVKFKLVEAVSALTGLGFDKISICKGK